MTMYLFVLFSFIGWLYEVGLAFLYGFGFVNRGFLFGPYLPIYGFGGLILVVSLAGVMKKPRCWGRVPMTPFLVFLLIVLITTVLEYAASAGLEFIFHKRWWDYSHYAFNLNGRVCLSASLRFGLGGMVFVYVLAPLIKRLAGKIPENIRNRGALLILGLLLLDFICTMCIPGSIVGTMLPM